MASDIFISYAREDRATAQSLADAFVAKGRSVWWDREIQGGSAFATEIEKALTGARLVVVLWSPDAVSSDFVRDEARRAMRNGKLLPVRIAEVDPPLGFGETHTLDMLGWDGSNDAQDLVELLRQVAERLDGRDTSPAPGPRLSGGGGKGLGKVWIGGGAAIAAAVAGAIWYLNQPDENLPKGCAPPSGSAVWAELDEGYGLLQKGDLATARSTFNRILSAESEFARARFYLAQVLIQTGENEIARGMLDGVLKQVGTQTHCALDEGEVRKMRNWLANLQSASDEPTPLPPRQVATTESPAPVESPAAAPADPTPGTGSGSGSGAGRTPDDITIVFRPAFGLGDKPRERIAPAAPTAAVVESAVEAAFSNDKDRRVAATTGLVVDPEALSDAVPLVLARAAKIETAPTAPDKDEMSGVINAMVLLQSATPATLNANRAAIESLLAKARDNGGQTAAQADRVAQALRKADGRKPLAYVQIVDDSQRAFATTLAKRLRAAGYEVPDFERVGNRAPAGVSEIRIQGRSDRELARWMAQTMTKLEAGEVRTRALRKVNPSNDTFEIWLARELCAPGTQRPASCE